MVFVDVWSLVHGCQVSPCSQGGLFIFECLGGADIAVQLQVLTDHSQQLLIPVFKLRSMCLVFAVERAWLVKRLMILFGEIGVRGVGLDVPFVHGLPIIV